MRTKQKKGRNEKKIGQNKEINRQEERKMLKYMEKKENNPLMEISIKRQIVTHFGLDWLQDRERMWYEYVYCTQC